VSCLSEERMNLEALGRIEAAIAELKLRLDAHREGRAASRTP
jgi:hypothetical protein